MTPTSALPGMRFTRLTIVAYAGHNARGERMVDAVCDCGATRRLMFASLRRGQTKSCGCYNRDFLTSPERSRALMKHGHSASPMYARWVDMLRRCEDPKSRAFHNYGGRGITVCARWHDVKAYVSDLSAPPSPSHEIDRIDNNGGYWCGRVECSECGPARRPCNVRWATAREQGRNKRNNRLVTINGVTRCAVEWRELNGISSAAFKSRIKHGWDERAALSEPMRKGPGAHNKSCRLTEEAAREICRAYLRGGESLKAIGDRFGVSDATVVRVVKGRSWSSATSNIRRGQ